MTYTDIIIVFVLVYFALNGTRRRVQDVLVDFISFLLAILIALKYYKNVSVYLVSFSVAKLFAYPIAFLILAVLTEGLLGYFLSLLLHKVKVKGREPFNKALSALLATGEGLIFVSFVVLLLFSFPISPVVKKDIAESKIGSQILSKGGAVEKDLSEAFGGVVEQTISYLTIEPSTTTRVALLSEPTILIVDEVSEGQLLELVNMERVKIGLSPLIVRADAIVVARNHAKDMWERSYFSHYSPEGDDVGDRLLMNNVNYFFAGENLALAPTASIAHTGLMQSQGHRENILNVDFAQIAIGVVDNGIYGKIFVQIFTD